MVDIDSDFSKTTSRRRENSLNHESLDTTEQEGLPGIVPRIPIATEVLQLNRFEYLSTKQKPGEVDNTDDSIGDPDPDQILNQNELFFNENSGH